MDPQDERLIRGACWRLVRYYGWDLPEASQDRATELAYGIATARSGVTFGAAVRAALSIVRRDLPTPATSTSVVEVRRPIPLGPAKEADS